MRKTCTEFPKRRSTWFITVLLVAASVAISLIFGEIIVRIVSPQKLLLNVTQWDPYVGFVHIPNYEGYSATEDFQVRIRINSNGLRDQEYDYSKPPDIIRIGVFGDSFTFGEGVQNDEPYPKILEQLFRRDERLRQSGVKVEVINFGIGKTGTAHQYAFYQKEGKKYSLDHVILGFLSGNDFTDNWGGVFTLSNDRLIHNATGYSSVRRIQRIVYRIPFYRWLATHSHLVNLLRKAVTLYDDRARMQQAATLQGEVGSAKPDLELQMCNLTLRIIEEFRKEALQNHSSFLIVHLPERGQKTITRYSNGELIPRYVVLWDALKGSLIERNFDVLDLVPVFSRLPKSRYYFEHDGHMTKWGHQVIAANVYEVVLPEIRSR